MICIEAHCHLVRVYMQKHRNENKTDTSGSHLTSYSLLGDNNNNNDKSASQENRQKTQSRTIK